jgi:hypothetical protein
VTRYRSLLALFLALLANVVVVPVASADTPQLALLTDVRVGAHPTYDRVVFDLTSVPDHGYTYVNQFVHDPSGTPVDLPTPASAFIKYTMTGASAHAANGDLTYTGAWVFSTPQLSNIRDIAIIGDYEGVLTVGLGLAHAAPVDMFALRNPDRLVIDVDH